MNYRVKNSVLGVVDVEAESHTNARDKAVEAWCRQLESMKGKHAKPPKTYKHNPAIEPAS